MFVYDCAGQETFTPYVSKVLGSSALVMIVFDVCSEPSLSAAVKWFERVKGANKDFKMHAVLVGNKTDLELRRTVSKSEAEEAASKYLLALQEKNEVVRARLREYELEMRDREELERELKALEEHNQYARSCHFMVSTKVVSQQPIRTQYLGHLTSYQPIREKEKQDEWCRRAIDEKFAPFSKMQYSYIPSLDRNTQFSNVTYGTKTFREIPTVRSVESAEFKTVFKGIPEFDKLGETYS
eukprot:sb/3469108/